MDNIQKLITESITEDTIFDLLLKTYEELEYKKKKIEMQNQLRTILTNVIPILLAGAPLQIKNMFIRELCNQIETMLWNKYLSKYNAIYMNILGENLCNILNEFGGKFEIDKVDDKKCVIKGYECSWGLESQKNPVLCMLCRCIFSRIAVKAFDKVVVKLDKTIGNRDEYCSVLIRRY